MQDQNNMPQDQNLSNDPEENLRIENELLKIKMQAERGAVFGGNTEELPPDIEAQFLKNVQHFEDSYDKARLMTVYECVGQPPYKKPGELKPEEAEDELKRLMQLLQSKNIILEVLGRYEPSVIYEFITDELFHEKIKDIDFPGYIHNFVYEEFHPNHDVDIGRTAQQFLDHWFEKSFDENCLEFSHQIVTAEGKTYTRNELIAKLLNCLDSYKEFKDIKFKSSGTGFEWDEVEHKGLGHAEGMLRYDAKLENGDTIPIEGPFKLYMINEDGFWRIFYFVFPGFTW
jgi:hypothetical protein